MNQMLNQLLPEKNLQLTSKLLLDAMTKTKTKKMSKKMTRKAVPDPGLTHADVVPVQVIAEDHGVLHRAEGKESLHLLQKKFAFKG